MLLYEFQFQKKKKISIVMLIIFVYQFIMYQILSKGFRGQVVWWGGIDCRLVHFFLWVAIWSQQSADIWTQVSLMNTHKILESREINLSLWIAIFFLTQSNDISSLNTFTCPCVTGCIFVLQDSPCPRGNAGESIKRMGELISA